MATNALETQGVVFKRGDGGSPEGFNVVGEVTNFDGPGGSANVIDATHLASTAREKLMGIPDEGQFTLELNLDPSDTEQVGLKDDRAARTKRNFTLTLTDTPATVLSFAGFVLEYRLSGGVDDKINLSVTIEITGSVTWS